MLSFMSAIATQPVPLEIPVGPALIAALAAVVLLAAVTQAASWLGARDSRRGLHQLAHSH